MVRCGHILSRQVGKMPLDCHFAGVLRQSGDWAVKFRLRRNVNEKIVDAVRADYVKHGLPVRVCKREIPHIKRLHIVFVIPNLIRDIWPEL